MRPKPPLLLDCVQTMALAWALVDDRFANRLCREVGPRGFPQDSLKEMLYDLIQIRCAEKKDGQGHTARRRFLEALGVKRKEGEKVSDTVLRVLRSEAAQQYRNRKARTSFAKAQKLVAVIHNATAQLLEMARADDWRQQCEERDLEQQRVEREAEIAMMRAIDRVAANGTPAAKTGARS